MNPNVIVKLTCVLLFAFTTYLLIELAIVYWEKEANPFGAIASLLCAGFSFIALLCFAFGEV